MRLKQLQHQAEARATTLLRKYGVRTAPIDVKDLAGKLGVGVIVETLDEDTSGILVIKNNQAVIGVNETHHHHRQRFTIAHELGHYLLHGDKANVFVDSKLTFYRDNNSSDGVYIQEITANAFAAELLMPRELLEQHLQDESVDLYDEDSVRWLAEQFDVSEQALTIRLTNLGLG